MSSATASQYAECDEFIQYQIESARRRIKWTELLTALLLTGVLLIGYILAFTVCDHWLVPGGFGAWTRAGMLAGVVFTCMGILYWFVIRPWTKQINPVFAAQMLDSEDPEFNGSLMSAVDLQQGDIQAPEQIRTAIEKRAAVRLADVDLEQAIDRNRMMQLAVALFALVLTTCLYAVFSPKSIDLLRPLSTANSTVATRTQILKVTPGDARVDAGQQLEITVDIGGTIPEQVLLTYTTADRSYVDEEVILETTDDEGRYRILLIGEADRGIRQDFTYQIHAGDSVSQDFYVEVTEPPRAIVTGMNLTYPEYMELEPRVVQQGSIDVWEGTVVKLHAEANVPLKS
ncbi:MAG TPA: hypothetical protein DCG12_23960, partial [Planctomycetaceae bacterium]|nr:hypothetical protein [Planctomycetaceae bacterium]